MFSKKKVYLAVLLVTVAICLFGFIWAWFVTREIRDSSILEKAADRKVVVNNLVLTETKDEKVYWELYAKSGSYESSNGHVVLNESIGNFYNKEQQVVLSFESTKGLYRESDKTIVLEGDTLIVARDGSSIRADKIVWKGRDEDIIASGNVVVKRNQDVYSTSDRAIFNYDLTFFKIEGNVVTNIYADSKETAKGQVSDLGSGEKDDDKKNK